MSDDGEQAKTNRKLPLKRQNQLKWKEYIQS